MPLDVVKTRMQQAKSTYSSSFNCAITIAKKEGVYAFWRGSSPRVVRLLVSRLPLQARDISFAR